MITASYTALGKYPVGKQLDSTKRTKNMSTKQLATFRCKSPLLTTSYVQTSLLEVDFSLHRGFVQHPLHLRRKDVENVTQATPAYKHVEV